MLLLIFNAAIAGEKPNVIIVIRDDKGTGDLGCNWNPYIITPALDDFKEEAVYFSNFHVSSTCAPSRGALMTGRHTNRLNVFHTISGRSLLFEDEVVLPQVLSDNGYTCGMFGKLHLGDNYPFRPEDRGFQEVVRHGGGGICQMPDYWGNDYFDDTYWHNGELEKYQGYCTDVFFNEALRFIEENRDHPFFCYLSTNAPHGPLNVPVKYMDMYEEFEQVPDKQKRFYGMITNIDDNFKRLEKYLEDLGQTKNIIDQYPDEVKRLAAGYEYWWQSFVDEGVNEQYAYIKAGTPHENPVRICSHDLLTGRHGSIWHQYGVARAEQAGGRWKVEIMKAGEYSIRLRRFPVESELAINEEFEATEKPNRLEKSMPASKNVGFREAQLIDSLGRVYPSYFVNLEKL